MSTFNISTQESSFLNNPNWDTKNTRSDIKVEPIKYTDQDDDVEEFINNNGFSISNNGYIKTSGQNISITNIANNNFARSLRSQLLSRQMRQSQFDFYTNTQNKLFPRYSITYFITNQNIDHTIFINANNFKSQSSELAEELSQYNPLSQNTHKQYTFIASDYYLGDDEETYEQKISDLANDIIDQYGGVLLDMSTLLRSFSIEFSQGNIDNTLSQILNDFRISELLQNNLAAADPFYRYNGRVIYQKGNISLRKYAGASDYVFTESVPLLKRDLPFGGSYKSLNSWPVAFTPYWMEDSGPCVKIRTKTPSEFVSSEFDNSGCWANPNFSNKSLEAFSNGVTNITDINLNNYYLRQRLSPLQMCKDIPYRECALWDDTQSFVAWHLARLNGSSFKDGGNLATMRHYAGRTKPRNTNCESLKDPVYVYVVDQPVGSGPASHPEFENRFKTFKGPVSSIIAGGKHGQNVASCIGGRNFGVTRKPELVSVGVLSTISGYGDNITIAKGILEVIADKIANPNRKILINMSLGGYSGQLEYLSQIINITITNPGSNYISEPKIIVIPEPDGYMAQQPQFKIELSNGQISNIAIIKKGSGFKSTPSISFSGGKGDDAEAVVTKITRKGNIEKIVISNGGSNYISAPTISIEDRRGSGAILEPVIENGTISAINIVAEGAGYTNPSIIITGGKGEDATATVEIGLVPQLNIMEIAIQKAVKDYNIPVVVAAGNDNRPANLFSPARLGSHKPSWAFSEDSQYVSVIGATKVGSYGYNPLSNTELFFFDNWTYSVPCGMTTVPRLWGRRYGQQGWWGTYYDAKTHFSNYGDAITAWGPGEDIIVAESKWVTSSNGFSGWAHGYKTTRGTSFSAPLAAGIVAEILRLQTAMPIDGVYAMIIPSILGCGNTECTSSVLNSLPEGEKQFIPVTGIIGLDTNRTKKTVDDIPAGGGYLGYPDFRYAGPDNQNMLINLTNPGTTQYNINDLDDSIDCGSYNSNISVNFETQPKVYGNNLIVDAYITT